LELFEKPEVSPTGDVVLRIGARRAESSVETPKLTIEVKFAS
jgi:3-methyladenine DNA glycosylase/8-oxoguanine DNA glycosylase